MKDSLSIVKDPKQIVQESVKFGLFSRKYYKEFKEMMYDFEDQTQYAVEINNLIETLESIKEFCEKHLNGQYEKIFIEAHEKYDGDFTSKFGKVILGRYETDKEWETRLEKKKIEQKQYESQKMRRQAKEYLALKKKFEGSEKTITTPKGE